MNEIEEYLPGFLTRTGEVRVAKSTKSEAEVGRKKKKVPIRKIL
jgi:hypothetical protein